MGAWGMGPFENDAALDFLGELADGSSDAVADGLRAAMTGVADEEGYLRGPEVDAAVAAACMIAARLNSSAPIGRIGHAYSDRLIFTVDEPFRELAARVFARAFDSTSNEWHDLWAEAGALAEVEAALAPFRAAVST
jgi:hypothetical protein